MYNVLIVDDEKIIRIGMRTIIDWDGMGFKVVDVVADGEKALEIIKKQHIDIVITDIKMPRMDGIQLIKALRAQAFMGEVIMLTSYGEFDLARECIRYGAHDYLLKGTLRPAELIVALEKVKVKLAGRVQESYSMYTDDCRDYEEEKKIKTIFNDVITKGSYSEVPFGFKKGMKYILFTLQVSKLHRTDREDREDIDLRNYDTAIRNILEEINDKNIESVIEINKRSCLYGITQSDKGQERIEEMALKIKNHIQLYTNLKVIAVVGSSVYTSKDFEKSLIKCIDVCSLTFYMGNSRALTEQMWNDIKDYKSKDYIYSIGLVKDAIREGNYNSAVEALIEYESHIRRYYIAIDQVRAIVDECIENVMVEHSIYLDKHKNKVDELLDIYIKSTTFEEIKQILNEFIFVICTEINQVKDKSYRKEIVEIMAYIEAHIDEKITLASIAEQINMNESYVSRLFKNETGLTIVNYINSKKMDKAKELLKEKDMIVKDVAYTLGYEEQSYFNKMFNKYVGMSPREYKKHIK